MFSLPTRCGMCSETVILGEFAHLTRMVCNFITGLQIVQEGSESEGEELVDDVVDGGLRNTSDVLKNMETDIEG